MARMGYVPESEDWTTELEQVLVVGYVHAPDRAPAVLEALSRADANQVADPPPTAPIEPRAQRRWQLPIEAKLVLRALIGIVAGIAIGLLVAVAFGRPPDAIILGVFGVLGGLIGWGPSRWPHE